MSEPGKYVLLKKVQPSSKNIKKAQKQKDKKLKKKLQKVQQKKGTPEIPKRNGTNNQQSHDEIGNKRKKGKQKKQKGNIKQKLNVRAQKNTSAKESQLHTVVKTKEQKLDNDVPSTKTATKTATKTFGDDLSERLKASRFRFINEQLYTQTGEQAIDVFKQDDSAFTAYHDGYRKQIEQWPINPLDRIIKSIKKLQVTKLIYLIYLFASEENFNF